MVGQAAVVVINPAEEQDGHKHHDSEAQPQQRLIGGEEADGRKQQQNADAPVHFDAQLPPEFGEQAKAVLA